MNDTEAIQRKLTEPACAGASAGRQEDVGFREMLHYLNQNEKDFSKAPTPEYREFIRLMKPLWDDPEWGNGPLDD